jgi:hypothetical protein
LSSLCHGARKYISDARDGQPLPGAATRLWVWLHRSICPLCRRYEKSLEHTLQAARALRDLPFEDDGNGSVAPTTDLGGGHT